MKIDRSFDNYSLVDLKTTKFCGQRIKNIESYRDLSCSPIDRYIITLEDGTFHEMDIYEFWRSVEQHRSYVKSLPIKDKYKTERIVCEYCSQINLEVGEVLECGKCGAPLPNSNNQIPSGVLDLREVVSKDEARNILHSEAVASSNWHGIRTLLEGLKK